MDPSAQTFLDGNAAAGELRDIFVVDLSAATGQCNSCGEVAAFAQTRVYSMEPGMIVRCSNCENALMRIVKTPECAWLDLRGLQYLQITVPA